MRLALGWACLVFLSPVPLARAQTALELDWGFAGRVVSETFLPLRVRIDHRGPAQEARLLVEQTVDSPWSGVLTERLVQPLSLGGRVHKQVEVLFFLRSTLYPLRVRLEGPEGAVLAERTVELHEARSNTLLSAALTDGDFPATLPTGERVYPLGVEDLPARAPGWGALGRLYLGRFPVKHLDAERREALLDWLLTGGELVVLAGANWPLQAGSFLVPWLPLVPQGLERLGPDGPRLLRGTPRGRVRFAVEGVPWLLERELGRGRLLLSALDPLSAEVPTGFWEALGPPPSPPAGEEMTWSDLALARFLRTRLAAPSRPALALWLGGFGLGGALWGWLAGRGRRGALGLWLWPLVYSGLLGIWLVRTEPVRPLVVAEYGLLETLPQGRAWERTWLGTFARRRAPLEVIWPADGLVRQLVPEQRGEHRFDLELVQEAEPVLREVVHAHQVRALLETRFGPAPLRWQLDPEAGTVTVHSALELRRAWLRRGDTLYDLGPLPAGTERTVALDRPLAPATVPPEVVELWQQALAGRPGPVLGGWHARPRARPRPADPRARVVHVLVSEASP